MERHFGYKEAHSITIPMYGNKRAAPDKRGVCQYVYRNCSLSYGTRVLVSLFSTAPPGTQNEHAKEHLWPASPSPHRALGWSAERCAQNRTSTPLFPGKNTKDLLARAASSAFLRFADVLPRRASKRASLASYCTPSTLLA